MRVKSYWTRLRQPYEPHRIRETKPSGLPKIVYLYLLMGEIFELHTWHLLFLSTFHCAYCLPLFSFSILLVLNIYLKSLPNHSVCNIWDIWVHNSSIKVESESSGARKQLWTVENNEYKIQRKFGNVVRCWIQVKPNM